EHAPPGVHETAHRVLEVEPAGPWEGTIVQPCGPSCSTRVRRTPDASNQSPAATQLRGDEQETPLSSLTVAPGWFADGTARQPVAVSRSARVAPVPAAVTYDPTATQSEARGHDSESS